MPEHSVLSALILTYAIALLFVVTLLRSLMGRQSLSFGSITHSVEEAVYLSDRILVFSARGQQNQTLSSTAHIA